MDEQLEWNDASTVKPPIGEKLYVSEKPPEWTPDIDSTDDTGNIWEAVPHDVGNGRIEWEIAGGRQIDVDSWAHPPRKPR